EQDSRLDQLRNARKAPLREVQRAKILLLYVDETPISQIQKLVGASRPTIYKCIDKALAAGADAGLKDYYHRPFDPIIDDAAKAWVINVACMKPKDLGLAAELWTYSELAKYTCEHTPAAGHPSLSKAVKATVWRILSANEIRPHKIKYYLERRDPDFEQKMQEVLIVYQEVNLQNDQGASSDLPPKTITVSVDEKPGVQAIANIAPDLPPKPGKHKTVGRDYEYKRLGTVSILSALDLHNGKIIGQVHDRHRSREFIELLKELDAYYPKESTIRVVLDNHSSHISKETMRYLASRPGRFAYVHTPKHGFWLNLIETAFSKMARTFLRHIRVSSKEELKERILLGIKEINSAPVVHHWKKLDLEVA
ncbi:MAG: IS630 family transposase, partial [Candidatus Marinimicrobia bacterium]|nr:IS630 family transposase [Candidatus Neomarinimicrobiota bacterium]